MDIGGGDMGEVTKRLLGMQENNPGGDVEYEGGRYGLGEGTP